MSRISSLLSSISSHTISSVSDGRETISDAEAVAAGAKLARDSFAPAPARAEAIASLLSTPERFESMAAYGAFLRAARPSEYPATPVAKSVRVSSVEDSDTFAVSARINGAWTQIGTSETTGGKPSTVIAGGGRYVLWSTHGSVGGFENSGDAIMSYDTRTGITTRVMDEHYGVSALSVINAPGGRSYVAARMFEEGDGEETFIAIVDPARGQVYCGPGEVVGSSPNGITVRHRTESGAFARETVSFATLASAEVIHNAPDEFADASLVRADMLAAWSAGAAHVIESTDNHAVWDAFERLRAQTESFAISNNYEEPSADTLYTMEVTNEMGAVNTVFAARQTLGETEIVTFFNDQGVVIERL